MHVCKSLLNHTAACCRATVLVVAGVQKSVLCTEHVPVLTPADDVGLLHVIASHPLNTDDVRCAVKKSRTTFVRNFTVYTAGLASVGDRSFAVAAQGIN